MDRPSWPSNFASKCVSVQFFIGGGVVTAVMAGAVVHHLCHRRNTSSSKSDDDDGGDDDDSQTLSSKLTARIRPPLRHTTPIEGEGSRIVYLTGIDKQTTQDELIDLFSCQMTILPIELDLSEVSFAKTGGRAWALYKTSEEARRVQSTLHQKAFHGCILCCRLELGVTKEGQRIVDRSSHTAIVRGIQTRRGTPTTQQQRRKKNKTTKATSKVQSHTAINNDGSSSYYPTSQLGPFLCKEIAPNNTRGWEHLPVTYSHRSISVGTIEYPFPSGLYLTKLIQRLSSFRKRKGDYEDMDQRRHRSRNDDGDDEIASRRCYGSDADDDGRMLDLLADVRKIGNGSIHKYSKEISEAMAMADALQRAIKIVYGVPPDDLASSMSFESIRCYCLGDGTYPVSAASIATFVWTLDDDQRGDNCVCSDGSQIDRDNVKFKPWNFVSIDPLLKIDEFSNGTSGSNRCADGGKRNVAWFDRIECFRGYSQEYPINSERDPKVLSIAIACHSHAPLGEFWGRMPPPKLCVSMPCCAQYSEIPDETPVLTYDDFEVYSPKRTIKIFTSFG